jgi:chemotaxis methyl-accepting protein methylase
VRVHNIVVDELEQGAFDLVHTRNALFHLSEGQTALGRMVSALKPGGALLVEEPDFSSWVADPKVWGRRVQPVFERADSSVRGCWK